MRVAIVGSGVSGLTCAHLLHAEHEITLFEADGRVGGHVHTVEADDGGCAVAVDTGFIVFNEATYPSFSRLLRRLGVESQPSTMSFGLRDDRTGLEWNGSSLDQIFAQRRNLLRPSFHRMVRDLARFRREAGALLREGDDRLTLGDYLGREGYSREFVEQCLVPMGASIWSADPRRFREFPARALVQFFWNHRFLEADQPQWRVVKGGSARYVEALTRPFRDRIRLATPVRAVRRLPEHVEVTPQGGPPQRFDRIIVATHSDQALRLLSDATPLERELLSAVPYQENDTVLHTDASVLPRARKAWGSWNYLVPAEERARVAVTYHMNRLQSLEASRDFCVSLNLGDAIAPEKVLRRFASQHPVFTPAGLAAQPGRRRPPGRPQPAPPEDAIELGEVEVRHEERVGEGVRHRCHPPVSHRAQVEGGGEGPRAHSSLPKWRQTASALATPSSWNPWRQ